MHIAIIGTRGVPASYSGFETCAEQVGRRLVERGLRVTVYCRSHHVRYTDRVYRGMELVRLPSIRSKYLDTIVHTSLASLHALTRPYDGVLMFIAGNSPVAWIPRLRGQKVVLNVDGLDWKRGKWPLPAKWYIQLAERLARWTANAVVTDSRRVQGYYEQRYHHDTHFIPYGADVQARPPGPWLERFGLQARQYMLFVGRLVPENCAHHLVEAFAALRTDMRCVVVGDAPYAEKYIADLKSAAQRDPRVTLTGYLFGEGYEELCSNAYAFVETSEVGGTHPVVLEAMSLGNCVVVNNTPENLETIGDAGLSYDGKRGAAALRQVLEQMIAVPDMVDAYRMRAVARVREQYDWEKVTDQYEELFRSLLTRGR